MPGAEPFEMEGSGAPARVGVLLVHGFTGCPASMRPWGEHLAKEGFTVKAPLLPGHGTRWQDLNKVSYRDWLSTAGAAFDDLASRCDDVFIFGLSMGGTVTLRLAELRGDAVAGIVTVNASLTTERKDAKLLPFVKNIITSFPPIASDIKKVGVEELAYPKLPVHGAWEVRLLWNETRPALSQVTAPVLAFRSEVDHVVEAVSGRILLEGLTSTTATEIVLHDSYHVATLDNDAPTIFAKSVEFLRTHATSLGGASAGKKTPSGA